ncbi:unnamed protein product [Prunus armeniaca]|uniref:Uncharacterized protein n=1 Tax=Prunus armeniaca TaxID=36596 RepID=A0A6J5USK0_PRUAR|nr:unnamed protein product [Prunus armeniaca]
MRKYLTTPRRPSRSVCPSTLPSSLGRPTSAASASSARPSLPRTSSGRWGKLGFDNYVEPLTLFLQKHRESENSDRSTLRAEFMKRDRAVDFGPAGPPIALMPPPPPYGPGYPFGPQHGPGMFDPSMLGMFRDGSSSGSGGGAGSSSASGDQGQNSLEGFDPFAQFK